MIELISSFFRDDHAALPYAGGIGRGAMFLRLDRLLPPDVLCLGTNDEGVTFYEWYGYVHGDPVRLVWDDLPLQSLDRIAELRGCSVEEVRSSIGAGSFVDVFASDAALVERTRLALIEHYAAWCGYDSEVLLALADGKGEKDRDRDTRGDGLRS